MANLHMMNVSVLDFCIWQHLRDNRSETQLQHLTTIPLIPVHKIYQHILNWYPAYHAFWYGWWVNRRHRLNLDSVLTYRNVHYSYRIAYTSRIRIILLLLLLVFTCQISVHWPLQPGNMQYTIVDDDVEVAPIYRCMMARFYHLQDLVKIMAWI